MDNTKLINFIIISGEEKDFRNNISAKHDEEWKLISL